VVGVLSSGSGGLTVLLRAGMDALPMQEKTDKPYKNTALNVSHACGHDMHVASLSIPDLILGTVHCFLTWSQC